MDLVLRRGMLLRIAMVFLIRMRGGFVFSMAGRSMWAMTMIRRGLHHYPSARTKIRAIDPEHLGAHHREEAEQSEKAIAVARSHAPLFPYAPAKRKMRSWLLALLLLCGTNRHACPPDFAF